MKTRLDFVTNSSSSSYIVGVKRPFYDEETIKGNRLVEVFVEYLDGIFPLEKGVSKENRERLLEFIEDNVTFGCPYEELGEWEKTAADTINTLVERGLSVYSIEVDYSEEGMPKTLLIAENAGLIEIPNVGALY